MIVAKRKPFEEIKDMIKGYKKVLNVGCGTCVAVCLAGGEKEVDCSECRAGYGQKAGQQSPLNSGPKLWKDSVTMNISRSWTILSETMMRLSPWPAALGIQFLAERFPDIPVYPGVDTTGMSAKSGRGMV